MNKNPCGLDYCQYFDLVGEFASCTACSWANNALAVYPQFKWERDTAIEQLDEYGISFGAKKDDDIVKVVRCKDCINFDYAFNYCDFLEAGVEGEDFFCAWGERKGGEDE